MTHPYPMCLWCCDEASPAHDMRTNQGHACLAADVNARIEIKRMNEAYNLRGPAK